MEFSCCRRLGVILGQGVGHELLSQLGAFTLGDQPAHDMNAGDVENSLTYYWDRTLNDYLAWLLRRPRKRKRGTLTRNGIETHKHNKTHFTRTHTISISNCEDSSVPCTYREGIAFAITSIRLVMNSADIQSRSSNACSRYTPDSHHMKRHV